MPFPKSTRFRYRELPKKEGKERRQRIAFKGNRAIEATTFQKNGMWVKVKGSSRARATARRL